MSKLLDEFRRMRAIATPWCAIPGTPDYRACYLAMLNCERWYSYSGTALTEPRRTQAVVWDCVNGPVSPIFDPDGNPVCEPVVADLGNAADDAPFQFLQKALTVPDDTIIFMVIPDQLIFEDARFVQALANLREPFKSKHCMIVLLGINFKLPELLSGDIPILEDPLPDETELTEVARRALEDNNAGREKDSKPRIELTDEELERAGKICKGMNAFAADEGIQRCFTPTGLNYQGLMGIQRKVIEESSNGALKYGMEPWTFADMGGGAAWVEFISCLHFDVVVLADEVDKVISQAASGGNADNTGVSQELLRTWLITLESSNHKAVLFNGGPGVGKTLSSICTANQFGARRLVFDMGACKSSGVGDSEAAMRRAMAIILAVGGENVLWIATCNRVETLPPEFQARFWLGTWYWDLPTEAEKAAIWAIQRKANGISPKDSNPPDAEWVGRDIRNCCRMAAMRGSTLADAARWITITGIVNRTEILESRDLAAKKGYRSACKAGAYQLPKSETKSTRAVRT
jgi:hypothetical protein